MNKNNVSATKKVHMHMFCEKEYSIYHYTISCFIIVYLDNNGNIVSMETDVLSLLKAIIQK